MFLKAIFLNLTQCEVTRADIDDMCVHLLGP